MQEEPVEMEVEDEDAARRELELFGPNLQRAANERKLFGMAASKAAKNGVPCNHRRGEKRVKDDEQTDLISFEQLKPIHCDWYNPPKSPSRRFRMEKQR